MAICLLGSTRNRTHSPPGRSCGPGSSYPRYSSTGHLIYNTLGTLWAVRFDTSRLEATGDPVPIQEGVLTKPRGSADFDVSENGSLIFVPAVDTSDPLRTLVWVDRTGREEALNAPPASYESPRISPDGQFVAVWVRDSRHHDVVVYDLERDTPRRLTLDAASDRYPLWTPEGQRLVLNRRSCSLIPQSRPSGTRICPSLTPSTA